MGNLSTFFVVVAAVALSSALYALWQSFRAAFGSGPADELSPLYVGDDRATLLAEKQAVLRNLKDLQFEREVGKISDEDFETADATYRARARELLRSLDADIATYRAEAAKLIETTSRAAHLQPSNESSDASVVPPSVVSKAPDAKPCTACGGANDNDAQFCKRCGARLEGVAT